MNRSVATFLVTALCIALPVLSATPASALKLTIIDQDNRHRFTFARSLKNGRQWLCQQKGKRLIPGTTVRTNTSDSLTTVWRSFGPDLKRARKSGNRRKVVKVKKRIVTTRKLCKQFTSAAASVSDDTRWWLDTAERNSMDEEDLFNFERYENVSTLRTESEETNIHSHYLGFRAEAGKAYLFTGEMKRGEKSGGVGVTFLSDYPNSDSYYRLRTYGSSNSFHIAPHGTNITSGDDDTGVTPAQLVWYSFAIYMQDNGVATIIKAKVWNQFGTEPDEWQVDCLDDSEDRLTSGLFGVWSMRDSWKHWRNLKIVEVD